tara:strand:- start:4 stop:519 length:516 start_codon:yes stop_codon:yes gene_type:complete
MFLRRYEFPLIGAVEKEALFRKRTVADDPCALGSLAVLLVLDAIRLGISIANQARENNYDGAVLWSRWTLEGFLLLTGFAFVFVPLWRQGKLCAKTSTPDDPKNRILQNPFPSPFVLALLSPLYGNVTALQSRYGESTEDTWVLVEMILSVTLFAFSLLWIVLVFFGWLGT